MFSIRMVAYWDDLGWTASSNLIQMPWQGDPKAKEDAGPAAWLGKPMGFLQDFFLETAWTYGNWSPDVPQSPDFLEAAYFHMFFLKISIIIIIYYPMVFSLRNFFEVLFSYVIFRVFPIISLEPYEFSNL